MWGNPTLFHRANLWKKIWRKDKYWLKLLTKILRKGKYEQNQFRKTF